jgi:hypothetical protein
MKPAFLALAALLPLASLGRAQDFGKANVKGMQKTSATGVSVPAQVIVQRAGRVWPAAAGQHILKSAENLILKDDASMALIAQFLNEKGCPREPGKKPEPATPAKIKQLFDRVVANTEMINVTDGEMNRIRGKTGENIAWGAAVNSKLKAKLKTDNGVAFGAEGKHAIVSKMGVPEPADNGSFNDHMNLDMAKVPHELMHLTLRMSGIEELGGGDKLVEADNSIAVAHHSLMGKLGWMGQQGFTAWQPASPAPTACLP